MVNNSKRIPPLAAAIAAGAIIGLAALAVKHVIAIISRVATSGFHTDRFNPWMLLLGIAAIMVSGWLVRHVVKTPLEHATARIKQDLRTGNPNLPGRLTVAPVAINAVTLGLGGSAGAEGPIAYTGAAIASRIARVCHMSEKNALIFLACGAGAGIAAIFKAPVGGMFFTIEVLRYPLAPGPLLILAAMCLTSGLTAYASGGFGTDIPFLTFEPFALKWYLPAIALGVFCGVYSLYYIRTGSLTARRLESIATPWKRNLCAGIALGSSLLLFPALYGEGYGALAQVLNGNTSAITAGSVFHFRNSAALTAASLAGVLLLKGIASYATNSGGGVAGEFAPTIFAGGMAGALFVAGAKLIPEWSALPAGDFIVLAMAAVMSGCIKAPLMAIFIVTEMTMSPTLLLPTCVTCMTSYYISQIPKFSKTQH